MGNSGHNERWRTFSKVESLRGLVSRGLRAVIPAWSSHNRPTAIREQKTERPLWAEKQAKLIAEKATKAKPPRGAATDRNEP